MNIRNAAILIALLVGLIGVFPTGARSDDDIPTWQHSAKFVCGGQAAEGTNPGSGRDADAEPVVPGFYETAINVHNGNPFTTVAGAPSVAPGTRSTPQNRFTFSPTFRKKALILYPTDPADGMEVATGPEEWVRPQDLSPDFGFEIDCRDIRAVLAQGDSRANAPLIKGYVVIEARARLPLDVTVAYTGYNENRTISGAPSLGIGGFAEDIETVIPRKIRGDDDDDD